MPVRSVNTTNAIDVAAARVRIAGIACAAVALAQLGLGVPRWLGVEVSLIGLIAAVFFVDGIPALVYFALAAEIRDRRPFSASAAIAMATIHVLLLLAMIIALGAAGSWIELAIYAALILSLIYAGFGSAAAIAPLHRLEPRAGRGFEPVFTRSPTEAPDPSDQRSHAGATIEGGSQSSADQQT